MFIVIGCGGRDWADRTVFDELFKGLRPDLVVTGGARGADSLCHQSAERAGLNTLVIPADWDRFGKSAGYRRNVKMADFAENSASKIWVAAAPGGVGTAHMVNIGFERGFTIVRL